MHKRSGEYNPYQFQIEYYVQLPEDIAVEIITDTEDANELKLLLKFTE